MLQSLALLFVRDVTMKIQRLNSRDSEFWGQLEQRLAWDSCSDKAIFDTVNSILAEVKSDGDKAVIAYTNKFDRMFS